METWGPILSVGAPGKLGTVREDEDKDDIEAPVDDVVNGGEETGTDTEMVEGTS